MRAEPKLADSRPKLRTAFDFAQEQVVAVITAHPEYSPLYTEQGKWKHGGEAWTNWC
jgi:unsaturated chondroitin disaccharide hydrolase